MKLIVYEIEWLDCRSAGSWFEADEEHPNAPMITYGVMVCEQPEQYVLASTYDPQDDGWADKSIMPKGMIKAIRVIHEREV